MDLVLSVYDIQKCRHNATIRGTGKDSSHVCERKNFRSCINLNSEQVPKFAKSLGLFLPSQMHRFVYTASLLASSLDDQLELKHSIKILNTFL